MPVIREKKNFSIGPVGVTRASEAGRITGQAIAQSANQIGGMFFEKAAKQAEEFGLKEGASVDREQVIAINPQTGEPEAYEPPQGLGSIGADAYQRVVMTRFQRSIEDEIRNKGQELAVRFEDNANGVALYTSAMSDYISSMTDVAQDEFKGYIADVGTTYLNATRTSMAATQVRRERAAAARAQRLAIREGIRDIELLAAQGGPAAFLGPTVATAMSNQVGQSISDLRNAGLSSEEDDSSLSTAELSARARGYLQFYSNNPDTPIGDLNSIQAAFATQNVNLIPNGYPELRRVAEGLSANPAKFRDLESFSDGLLSETITYRQGIIDAEVAALEVQDLQLANDLALDFPAESFRNISGNVSGQSLDVAVPYIINTFESMVENSDVAFSEGLDSVTKQRDVNREAFLTDSVTALARDSLVGRSSAEIEQLQQAIISRNYDEAPASTIPFLNSLIEIETATGTPLTDLYSSVAQEYKARAAGFVDSTIAADEAQRLAQEKVAQELRDSQSQIAKDLNILALEDNLTTYSEGSLVSDLSIEPRIVVASLEIERDNLTNEIRNAIEAQNPELEKFYRDQRDHAFNSAINRMVAVGVQGLNTSETNDVFDALSSENPEDEINSLKDNNTISALAANAFIAAIRVGENNGAPLEVKSILEAGLNSHRSEAAAGVDADEERAADSLVVDIVADIQTMGAERQFDSYNDIESSIANLSLLDSEKAETLARSLNGVAGRARLDQFFSNYRMSDQQAALARRVLQGATQESLNMDTTAVGEFLSPRQIIELQQIRDHAEGSANSNQILNVQFNNLMTARADVQRQELQLQEEKDLEEQIRLGQASPSDVSARIGYDNILNERYGEGVDVSTLWAQTDSVSDPTIQLILNDVNRTGILPESLQQTFAAVANGEFRVGDVNAVLSHYVNLRTYEFEGQKMESPAMGGLDSDQKSTLDYLADVIDIEGNVSQERMASIFNRRQEFLTDERVENRVTGILGEPLSDFIFSLDSIYEIPASGVNALRNAALQRIATSGGDISARNVRRYLERQIKATYPEGREYVRNSSGGDRTRYPISFAAPNRENLFKTHVNNVVAELTERSDLILGGDLVGYNQLTPRRGTLEPDHTYLVPLAADSETGEISYIVHVARSMGDGGDITLNRTVVENGVSVLAPVIISNKDPAFLAAVSRAKALEDIEAVESARRRETEEENPMFGLGGIRMGRFFE